mgnify:CR=1 FL=1
MDPITLSTATDRQSITGGTCNLSSEVSALCFAFLAEEASRSTEFPVLLPQTFYNNSTLVKLLDIEMMKRQCTNMVSIYRRRDIKQRIQSFGMGL